VDIFYIKQQKIFIKSYYYVYLTLFSRGGEMLVQLLPFSATPSVRLSVYLSHAWNLSKLLNTCFKIDFPHYLSLT